jgi:diadenosine tetraphosphate (Ap4A) HIT family hydrolase
VNHAVGPLNTGTLVLAPRQHVVAVADLDDTAAAELGPLVRETARVVEALTLPEQTYVCSWAHGPPRRHLHVVVQAATRALVAEYGGLRAEQLQARMLAGAGHHPAAAEEVSRFCTQAREMFRAPGMVSTT